MRSFGILATFFTFFLWYGPLQAQQKPKPIRMVDSKPIKVNGVEFVTSMVSECVVAFPQPIELPGRPGGAPRPSQPNAPATAHFDVQLRLTNHADKDLAFSFDRKLTIKIKTKDKKELPSRPLGAFVTPQQFVIIPAGKSYCLSRTASIFQIRDETTMFYRADAVIQIATRGIEEGISFLSFEYANTTVPADGPNEVDGVQIWTGTAVTPEIAFRVVLPPAVVSRR
jgi:hypothetical protein